MEERLPIPRPGQRYKRIGYPLSYFDQGKIYTIDKIYKGTEIYFTNKQRIHLSFFTTDRWKLVSVEWKL